jgi:hypothetical protein
MKLRIAIAVLLALIFALVTIPTFFIRSIVKTYLNPSFYDGPVIEESHEYLIDNLNKQIAEDKQVSAYFSEEDIAQLTNKYITSNALRTVIQDFITQMDNISDGRKANIIAVSLMPLKENIPNMASDIAVHIVGQTPYCEDEIEDPEAFISNGLPDCIPLEIEKSSIENPLALEIEKNLYDMIPGEFSLDLNSVENEETAAFTQLLFIFKYVQMILPLFMLIILLLITLIIYKPYTRIMKFIGGSFALGGIFSLIAAQLFAQVPDMYKETINGLNDFYSFLIDFIVERINIYSVYFIGIGSLIVLIAFYLSHYYEKHPNLNDS